MIDLPERLIALRKQNGLTQMDVAQKLNVSRQAISRWEVGAVAPNADNLRALADLYGVSVDRLLREEADDLHVEAEKMEQPPKIKTYTTRNKHWVIFVCIAVLLSIISIVLSVVISVTIIHRGEERRIIPMEEMSSCLQDDRWPTVTIVFD